MSHEGNGGEKQAMQAFMFPIAPRALNNCRDAFTAIFSLADSLSAETTMEPKTRRIKFPRSRIILGYGSGRLRKAVKMDPELDSGGRKSTSFKEPSET